MEITPIGWILISFGAVFSIFYPEGLYALTIFFIPFSATSILNIGSGDTGAGIQPYMFLGFLLLLRECGVIVWRSKIRLEKSIQTPTLLYLLFLLVSGVSLLMPIWIDGSVEVPSRGTLDATLEPLVFDAGRVRIFFGLIYTFFLTIFIAKRNLSPSEFTKTARIYLTSGVFVSLWGLLQLILYLVHIPYPYMLFNNSASPNALGYEAVVDTLDIRRVSSVALEPSSLATTLIGMIPFLVMSTFAKAYIFGKYLDRVVAALLIIVLILTTSSTGYLGFLSLCFLFPFSWPGLRKARTRLLFLGVALVVLMAAAYAAVPQVRDILAWTVLDKAGSYSALERWAIIYIDLGYFLQYPMLGVGWGSTPTHDTIIGLLASCGLLGFGSFVGLIGFTASRLVNQVNSAAVVSRKVAVMAGIMFLSLCATMMAYLVSGLPGGGTFTLILGLSIAAIGLREKSARPSNYLPGIANGGPE